MIRHAKILLLTTAVLYGCSKEQPVRTVAEFIDKPILLEAAMLRCARDRVGTRYEAECVNAREAVAKLEAGQEAARKAEMDARSESKRRALRRTQQAAASARQRAAEAERLRREAEYLAQFGVVPGEEGAPEPGESGNSPLAVVPEPVPVPADEQDFNDMPPATDGGNAPTATTTDDATSGTDLDAIREEIRRRNSEETQ